MSPIFSDQRASIDAATANVRDHIEKVVESLVGDNLDSVNIIKISNDQNCEKKYAENNLNAVSETHKKVGRRRTINIPRFSSLSMAIQGIRARERKRRIAGARNACLSRRKEGFFASHSGSFSRILQNVLGFPTFCIPDDDEAPFFISRLSFV